MMYYTVIIIKMLSFSLLTCVVSSRNIRPMIDPFVGGWGGKGAISKVVNLL